MTPTQLEAILAEREGYVPCPTCHQYSHSLGDDAVAQAYNHFHSMYAHPVRGHPMGVSSDDAGYAYQKAPVATNATRALTPAHQLDAETVVDAVIELLKYRVGEQPEQGWLRDNDASRTALTNLARALKDTPNEQR